jgi:hypothetical protein
MFYDCFVPGNPAAKNYRPARETVTEQRIYYIFGKAVGQTVAYFVEGVTFRLRMSCPICNSGILPYRRTGLL